MHCRSAKWIPILLNSVLIIILLLPSMAIADLTVFFLDVGQGDSAVIVCDGEAMIIDGGLPGQSSKIFSFIENDLQCNRFLYMVATHPDNDHIGGLPAVFEVGNKIKKQVKTVYSPVTELETPRFTDLKNKADAYKVKIKIPYDRQEEYLGSAKVTFYNCGRQKKNIVRSFEDWVKSVFKRDDPEEDKENNDMSLVVKITYGDTIFLFTGDIETEAESRLIAAGFDLGATVLKVAHHGSRSSSSIDFLTKVNPKYAVISCGKGNRYGHPNQQTLDELKRRNVELYRTDLQGTITCHSDGHTITFETTKTAGSDLFKAPEIQ